MSKKNKGFGFGEELDPMVEETKGVEQEVAGTPDEDAVKLAAFKEKKKAAAKRHAEKVKANKERDKELAQKSLDLFKEKGIEDKELIDWLNSLIVGHVASSNTGSNFEKAFGTEPKVGDSITYQDVLLKLQKNKSNFDFYVKKWKEKGIVIEFVANKDLLQSTYVIRQLPN